ncbi:MAG: hypothetical protein Q9165_000896 [Trypethelium subeluteriae]
MPSTQYAPIQTSTHNGTTNEYQDSSGSSHGSVEAARLTPDPESEEEDEDDFEPSEAGQSFQLQHLAPKPLKSSDTIDGIEEDEGEEGMQLQSRRRASVQSFELYTPDEENAVIRRLDRRLVLFMALLYMLSFLDRSNIGNARIAGLVQDLNLTGQQYEWLLTAFYITYILFEWMTLMYDIITIAFQGTFVANSSKGLFISAAPLATSFASTLAWVITKIGKASPIAPWRLLFLVEGFPSVLAAVFAWSHVPDNPKSARFLTTRQRKVAKIRLRSEGSAGDTAQSDSSMQGSVRERIDLHEVLQTLVDPKMGYSSISSQALSAPPYLAAFIVVLITAFLSDRTNNRGLFIALHALLAASGYALIAATGAARWSPLWRYCGIYPAAAGFFSAVTLIITWTINNQESDSKKGTGMAMLNVIGQCGPLLGTRLYPDADKPYYVKGMSICAGFMLFVLAGALGLRAVLKRANTRKRLATSEEISSTGNTPLVDAFASRNGRRQFIYIL